jgi:fucose permease
VSASTSAAGRARWNVTLVFLLTGVVFTTWAARIPAVKANLGLSDAQLAVAFIVLNGGAIAGLQAGAILVARFGSRASLLLALPAFAAMLVVVALAVDLLTLAVALAVSALANSVVDVAMNEQGFGLENRHGRPLLSGMHAMQPLGGIIGGGLAAVAARAELPLVAHFGGVALIAALAGAFAASRLLPHAALHLEEVPVAKRALPGRWTHPLVLLGAVSFIVILAEGATMDWTAVLLHESPGASPAAAAAAVTVFLTALTGGRLLGDRLVEQLGPVAVFRVAALAAGGGLGAGLLVATPAAAFAGIALLGLGLAPLFPMVVRAAASGGLPVAVAVARVSMIGYAGSLVGPAAIGLLAHRFGLTSALLLPAVAIVLAGLAGGSVRGDRRIRQR